MGEEEAMPDLQDLVRLVRGPVQAKPLPAIWDYFPATPEPWEGWTIFLITTLTWK